MSVLDLGTLRGFLDLDDTPFDTALDKAGDKLKGFGGKGAALAAGAGVAIAGAMVASLVKGMNVEAANDKLAAQLGLSEQQSARIGKAAGELYASNYGESLDGVNDAIKSVMQNIDGMKNASNADLEDITKKVLNLSTTFDQDLGMTTAAVGQMMRTGMAKNAKEALDILTVGLQGPANKADDLMETFNEYGTQFRKLGLNGKTALGLMSQGMKGGARDADIVADSLKEFSLRTQGALEQTDSKGRASLTALGSAFQAVLPKGTDMFDFQESLAAGGKKSRDGLDTMLDGIRKIKDPLYRSQMAVALFGTQAEDMGAALYSLDPSKAVDSLGKVGGAADKMDKTLNDNAIASLESLKRQAQTAFGSLMNWALPAVNELAGKLSKDFGPALQVVLDVGKDVDGFFKKHTTTAKILAGVIGALAIVTAAHSAALAVGAAGGMVAWLKQTKLISAATKVWTAIQWLWNAAMSANPIALVVIAIAALVAGVILAYKKVDWFRNGVNAVLHAVAEVWRWLWNSAIQPVLSFLAKGIAWIMDKFGDMLAAMSHVPGFGWAKDAADKMHGAADKARELGDNIKKIPPYKKVTVDTVFNQITIKSIQDKQANDPRIVGHNAAGTSSWRGGLTLVHERGGELLDLPAGTRIWPHDQSLAIAAREGAAAAARGDAGGQAGPSSLFRDLVVQAQPGAERADVDRVVTSVVYHMGLAARSGRWATA